MLTTVFDEIPHGNVRRPNTRSTSIYWLVDTRTNRPFYCGKTVLPLSTRLTQHKYEAAHGNRKVHAKVRECGDHVRIHLMETVPPGEDWGEREKRWIYLLRQTQFETYNSANGGAGVPGRITSDETKARLSALFKGKFTHTVETRAKLSAIGMGRKRSRESVEKGRAKMLGRKLTPEQHAALRERNKMLFAGPRGDELRAIISRRRKGIPVSEETRAKLSAAHRGRKHTDATKEKLRIANTGRKMSAEAIAKSATARTGQKRTPEQRARMSATHKGKKWTQAQRDAIPAGMLASWKRRKEAARGSE